MAATAFDFAAGEWSIRWPERISQYDMVFESPMEDPMHHGIPFGDGTTGGLIWTEKNCICISLNRCDLWEAAKGEKVTNWKPAEEDRAGTLRHACRLVIDCKLPVFDTEYITAFKARLSLADGVITVDTNTLFGAISFRAWMDRETHSLHISVKSSLQDGICPEIRMERFPSRTHSHWYAFLRRDAELGLDKTSVSGDGNTAYLSYRLSTGTFTCAFAGKGLSAPAQITPYCMGCAAEAEASLVFTVTSPMEAGSAEQAKATLCKATAEEQRLSAAMQNWWKSFWMRSFMDGGEDYENALWHLWMYALACSQGGSYPGRFINGLFGWNRDIQNWNYYFHWNQHELYWGLNAAGHPELCESYLNYRFNAIPYGKKDAKERFGVEDGIYVSDVCDYLGRNSSNEFYNRTPSAGIAMDFWRQYLYTMDEGFLREKAAPYVLGAARFLASLFHKEQDGKYHARGGSCYEGLRPIDEPLTETFSARVLLPIAIRAAELTKTDLPEREHWLDIIRNLADPVYIPANEKRLLRRDGKFFLPEGPYAGKELASEETLAAGIYPETKRPIPMDEIGIGVPFHAAWIAPAFPIEAVSLRDKGSRVYDALANVLLVRAPTMCGWDPLPIAMAKMGMAEQAETELHNYAGNWQRYDNGLGHYNVKTMGTDVEDLWTESSIEVLEGKEESSERIMLNMAPFRHCGMEPCGVFTGAMNERLLQSFEDGTIYIAPAVSKTSSVRFSLWAKGNVRISAEVKDGKPLFVHLYAPVGAELTVADPFGAGDVRVSLQPGESKTLLPAGASLPELSPENPEANRTCRKDPYSKMRLGLPVRY